MDMQFQKRPKSVTISQLSESFRGVLSRSFASMFSFCEDKGSRSCASQYLLVILARPKDLTFSVSGR